MRSLITSLRHLLKIFILRTRPQLSDIKQINSPCTFKYKGILKLKNEPIAATLAEARTKATELKLQIRSGIDPIAHKQQQLEKLHVQKLRDKTFKECAKVIIANKTRVLKNDKHIGQWSSTLETYIYPTLGNLTIGTITKVDIAEALKPI